MASKEQVDAVMTHAFGKNMEWWRSSTEESYRQAAGEMLDFGMPHEVVSNILCDLRAATGGEYGD